MIHVISYVFEATLAFNTASFLGGIELFSTINTTKWFA